MLINYKRHTPGVRGRVCNSLNNWEIKIENKYFLLSPSFMCSEENPKKELIACSVLICTYVISNTHVHIYLYNYVELNDYGHYLHLYNMKRSTFFNCLRISWLLNMPSIGESSEAQSSDRNEVIIWNRRFESFWKSMDLVGYRFYLGLKNRPFVK